MGLSSKNIFSENFFEDRERKGSLEKISGAALISNLSSKTLVHESPKAEMLHISTSVWVLRTSNTGRNMFSKTLVHESPKGRKTHS